METVFYIMPQIRDIVMKRHLTFWVNPKTEQKIFFIVKKRTDSVNPYALSIYSTTGKYFHLQRNINEK